MTRGSAERAGEGNRTLVFSLEGYCSTIELHPLKVFHVYIGFFTTAFFTGVPLNFC